MSDKDMSNVPTNDKDLREMVYHTDARVTALEGEIRTIGVNQGRDTQKLDMLIHTLNQPRQVNYAAWVGVGITVMVLLVTGTMAMVNYISLTQDPVVDMVKTNTTAIAPLNEWQNQTHYEFGVLHDSQKFQDSEINKLWDHIHKQEEELKVMKDVAKRSTVTDEYLVKWLDSLKSRLDRSGVQ